LPKTEKVEEEEEDYVDEEEIEEEKPVTTSKEETEEKPKEEENKEIENQILMEIEMLQNDGRFRVELLHQLQEINKALVVIAGVLVDLSGSRK
jgi:hypothetical protein